MRNLCQEFRNNSRRVQERANFLFWHFSCKAAVDTGSRQLKIYFRRACEIRPDVKNTFFTAWRNIPLRVPHILRVVFHAKSKREFHSQARPLRLTKLALSTESKSPNSSPTQDKNRNVMLDLLSGYSRRFKTRSDGYGPRKTPGTHKASQGKIKRGNKYAPTRRRLQYPTRSGRTPTYVFS